MIRTPVRSITRALLAACLCTGAAGAPGVLAPATAGAYATIEGPSIYSSAPGLPDDRAYELVSPADDNGNEAGASSLLFTGNPPGNSRYSVASAEGDSVLFEGTGPMGETASASMLFFVATRTSAGWKTRSVLPAPRQPVTTLRGKPGYISMSRDFSHALIQSAGYTLAPAPENCQVGGQAYITEPNPLVSATWLSRSETGNPSEVCNGHATPAGGSPDLSTVYFAYSGTLLAQDATRLPHLRPLLGRTEVEAQGLYEYSQGTLREAGVLPDGSLDPFGAVPADSWDGESRAPAGNQVSADGSRAFFVSPDPLSCEQNEEGALNDCASDPPELYVREDGVKTLLVSKDTLLPEAGGLPVQAPNGVVPVNHIYSALERSNQMPYVFASPDGSQAFFQSDDRLNSEVPQGPSENSAPKTYDFDVDTGALTYLPNVVGKLVGSDADGSSLVFVSPATETSPAELDLWSAGPGDGSITQITQLPEGEEVEPVRMTSDGSVVVFMASSLPGFNDAGVQQIFRFEVSRNTLGCVSCSPAGVAPAVASMSILREGLLSFGNPGAADERGMSANGDRVFFQTQTPLVPQDTNTGTVVTAPELGGAQPQGADVYEWENGVVYLLSSGKSPRDSYFLDNSESGNDVFFATTENLVPGDTDGGYSVYDARVPRPGDTPPPAAVPCEGAVCQGPPRVQSPLAAPASATFSGLGNTTGEPAVTPAVKSKAMSKAAKCRKGYVKKKNGCIKKPKAKKAKFRSKKSAKGRK
jgi:hypothetical protein